MKEYILPRFDLREPAFRKYETIIAEACLVTQTINPQTIFERPISAHTFAVRIRDAMLGYQRYHYPSRLIPPNFDLRTLKVDELTNGNVIITNPKVDATKNLGHNLHANNPAAVHALLALLNVENLTSTTYPVAYSTPTERDFLLSLGDQYKGISTPIDNPAKSCVEFF